MGFADASLRSIRRAIPRGLKDWTANLIAGPTAGRMIRAWSGKTIGHRGTRIAIDHPRVSDEMVGALYWWAYERAEADQISRFLPRDQDVIELGASSGVNTSLIASRLDPKRRVYSVEADPELIALARRNAELNGFQDRISFYSAALAYDVAEVRFARGATPFAGKLAGSSSAPSDTFAAPAITLSHIVGEAKLDRFTLVMDIEGAEWAIISRPQELAKCGAIIAELHDIQHEGREITADDMVAALEAQGFRVKDRYGVCVVLERT